MSLQSTVLYLNGVNTCPHVRVASSLRSPSPSPALPACCGQAGFHSGGSRPGSWGALKVGAFSLAPCSCRDLLRLFSESCVQHAASSARCSLGNGLRQWLAHFPPLHFTLLCMPLFRAPGGPVHHLFSLATLPFAAALFSFFVSPLPQMSNAGVPNPLLRTSRTAEGEQWAGGGAAKLHLC